MKNEISKVECWLSWFDSEQKGSFLCCFKEECLIITLLSKVISAFYGILVEYEKWENANRIAGASLKSKRKTCSSFSDSVLMLLLKQQIKSLSSTVFFLLFSTAYAKAKVNCRLNLCECVYDFSSYYFLCIFYSISSWLFHDFSNIHNLLYVLC